MSAKPNTSFKTAPESLNIKQDVFNSFNIAYIKRSKWLYDY